MSKQVVDLNRRRASALRGPRSAAEVMGELAQRVRTGDVSALAAVPTGFKPLDRFVGGGFRPGDLVLVGGAQSVGKTTLALQMARNIVSSTQAICVYFCFEHTELDLLQRLIALEAFLGRKDAWSDPVSLTELRELLVTSSRQGATDGDARPEADVFGAIAGHPDLAEAV